MVILRKSFFMLFLHETQLNDVSKHHRTRIGVREHVITRCKQIRSHLDLKWSESAHADSLTTTIAYCGVLAPQWSSVGPGGTA